MIRRHQSRCQRRPRRGPHRLPIHKSGAHVSPAHAYAYARTRGEHVCVHVYAGGRGEREDTRERDGRISSDFSTADRGARCYVKLDEKAGIRDSRRTPHTHTYTRTHAPSPPRPLSPLEFLMRPFSGRCPRKSRTAAGTRRREELLNAPTSFLSRWPLPLHLPVFSSFLFLSSPPLPPPPLPVLFFSPFFFVISVEP